jgi:choice-of-anchor B domain-containing protein
MTGEGMERCFIRKILVLIVISFFVCSKGFSQSQELLLLAHVNSYSDYNDCWGYTALDGREYALLGVRTGTSIIDVTDSSNVYEVDFIPSVTSTWKDIKTYRHYAYAVNESGGGLQIFDLSDLPNSVTELPAYTGLSTSHNIYIDVEDSMLYAEGEGSAIIRAISLADPEHPVQLSTFGLECHDIYARNDTVYVSEGNHGSIGIYDLSDPTIPTFISRINVPSSGYVHNTWLSDDGNFLMSTEETPGKTVKYWNIQNLDNASIADTYLGQNNLAHNAHIKGNYAYLSHYESGLKVLDISNPDSIFEVGYYDTYPQGESPNFNGAWGAFPFFGSGKVLISDIQTGLYVVYFKETATHIKSSPKLPTDYLLEKNYPNPFNPTTTVVYQLSRQSEVQIEIYNLLGQKVRTLLNERKEPGAYEAVWDGKNDHGKQVGSGIYLYRMVANEFVQVRKMILMR